MEYKSETKTCQNCKKDFIIEPDDFSFYEKVKVPAPTFCSECRFQKRIMFRNEIVFYKRQCDLCRKNIISIFSPEKEYKVFCSKCWWGDNWNPGEYYLDYSPQKTFFEQFKELQSKTPFMEKVVDYPTLTNCEYVNHSGNSKNCYLMFNADFCENVFYSSTLDHVKDSADCLMMNKTELSYECIGGDGSGVYFSENCPESINVWYSKDCVACHDCFGCVNLRHKSYYIFNKSYSKEEYQKKIKEMKLDKYSSHLKIQEKIYGFWNKFPRRYMYGRMNKNSSGDYVYNSKNAKNCYQAVHVEDGAYSQLITIPTFKDSFDITEFGMGVEHSIDSVTVGYGVYGVKYCSVLFTNARDVEYSMYGGSLKNCFGCLNIRNKEFCILNKQYSREEYEKLKNHIIKDMKENPYIDKLGRVWRYGDFFPYDLSPFAYNESFANLYFPLNKEKIEKQGFGYFESQKTNYQKTMELNDVPDSIKDIQDDFVEQVMQCGCGKFYRIAKGELLLLKRFVLPIPRSCPDCRYMKRIKRLNPPRLYNRKCDKCGIEIKTPYAPNRPEIVYCEKCYQQEVY